MQQNDGCGPGGEVHKPLRVIVRLMYSTGSQAGRRETGWQKTTASSNFPLDRRKKRATGHSAFDSTWHLNLRRQDRGSQLLFRVCGWRRAENLVDPRRTRLHGRL